MLNGMTTTIDNAGRIVIPKAMRDQLGLTAGRQIQVELRDGKLELEPKNLVTYQKRGRFLVAVMPPGTPFIDNDILAETLNDLREGRIK